VVAVVPQQQEHFLEQVELVAAVLELLPELLELLTLAAVVVATLEITLVQAVLAAPVL
jgi:hypothetical protein